MHAQEVVNAFPFYLFVSKIDQKKRRRSEKKPTPTPPPISFVFRTLHVTLFNLNPYNMNMSNCNSKWIRQKKCCQ